MFDRLLEMFTGPAPRLRGSRVDELQLAVAALLIEAARMDDGFDAAEQQAIRDVLARRFGLAPTETDRLLTAAEEAQDRSVGMYRHIRRVTDDYDADQRIELIEMLWEVAYADGRLDPQEDALVRRIAGLVHVSDQDRGAARKRVLARRATA
ncbi:putative tellurite resistance protein B-like protein [Stella humosa]|uniref:Putative tellurite resistance protein B-like protein n=1 Tax=Stella humosa TaxID=94 RepID=A0A3N1L147_9PROT|nr:TerB family tellurite resistance protein [Stella humosa]ROP83235.1 putative tellurite resistance protein B-like protein [Stella humosa]BBK29983.1 hypothetical protein STHU_06170 [Stella humosa]